MKYFIKNKRYLSIIAVILTVTLLLIISVWYIILNNFTQRVNNNYSNQDIVVLDTPKDSIKVRFKAIKPQINLLSVEFDIYDLEIINNTTKTFCRVPINIKYSILSGSVTVKYNGKCSSEVLSSVTNTENDNIKLNLVMLSKIRMTIIQLLHKIINLELVQIINYLGKVEFVLDEYVVYTKGDDQNIKHRFYDSLCEVSCSDSQYYSTISDIWHNMPQNYFIDTKLKIEYLNSIRKTQEIELQTSFSTGSSNVTISDILDANINGKLNIQKFNYDDDKLHISNNLDYQNMLLTVSMRKLKLNTECVVTIKDKEYIAQILLATLLKPNDSAKLYFDFNSLQDMINFNYYEGAYHFFDLYTNSNVVDSYQHNYLSQLNTIGNLTGINHTKIPNQVKLILDYEISLDAEHISIKVNSLELALDNLGIKMGSLLWDSNRRNNLTIHLYILNFKELIDTIVDFKIAKGQIEHLFYSSNQLTPLEQTVDDNININFASELKLAEIYREVMKSFILRISSLPKIGNNFLPNARVIRLNYKHCNVNSQQCNDRFTIGNLTSHDIRRLYYLTLYDAVKETANKSDYPNKVVQQFFPELQNNTALAAKLENADKLINEEFWEAILQEIITIYSIH